MAIPKIFISSTCFDLLEVREQLKRFVKSFGFDPILSEYGDVFFHPDLNTQDACVNEVSNCQLFILIIGGRFGGNYNFDKDKSITNAEYEAAKKANIPIFTYIKNGVLSNHHIYRENKKEKFVNSINFPAIEKQENAENIFKFVDEVRRSPTNNAFEGFDNFNDIESHLRKQWAGLFFEFLKTREIKLQIDATNHLLNSLQSSNTKLEELVKSLYRASTSNSTKTEESISEIEIVSNIKSFFIELVQMGTSKNLLDLGNEKDIIKIANTSPDDLKWDEYLVKTGLFTRDGDGDDIMFHTQAMGLVINDKENYHPSLRSAYEKGVKKSTREQRVTVISELQNTVR